MHGYLVNTVNGLALVEPEEGWIPARFELDFGREGFYPLELDLPTVGRLNLNGTIDRVDINSQGELRVIDYKTGGSHLAEIDLKNGRRLQLPLYALAAEKVHHLGGVVDGFYWALRQGKPSRLRLATFKGEDGSGPQAALALVLDHVQQIVTGIREGYFAPVPPAGGCPSYCPAADWCWQYTPSTY